MKAVIQRVESASVTADGRKAGSCGMGFLVLVCAVRDDTDGDARTSRFFRRKRKNE